MLQLVWNKCDLTPLGNSTMSACLFRQSVFSHSANRLMICHCSLNMVQFKPGSRGGGGGGYGTYNQRIG
ncbi:hypothetical protein T12_623 [Trichinella patagoniensis]|uniref:Uncharacterized protein n=1 Tax=Trichinella patagoniensis TaxID=990121 RepID=A0A0V0ZMX7_9BILA|nr:hypothetical protein T12_623 [Trichinella patagoniensis]